MGAGGAPTADSRNRPLPTGVERLRDESHGMPPDDRRRRLELAVPFWTYLAIISVGLVMGIVIGLTHH
jgi:hypothetical protein